MIRDTQGRVLIFDAFIKGGVLTLISTYYHKDDSPLRIVVNGLLATEYGFNEREPIRYFKVPVTGTPTIVIINDILYPLNVSVIEQKKRGLAVATLFKDDHMHISEMINFYRKQGVTYFYFFYNGPVLPEGLPHDSDIQYGLWDVQYWNHCEDDEEIFGWQHCAQMTFLSMMRNKYLDDHTWLGFIDIDEYIYPTEGISLVEELENSPSDVAIFLNHWAKLENGHIFYVSEGLPYRTRSKAFYKGSFDGLITIHFPKRNTTAFISTHLKLLHIITFTHPERIDLIPEPLEVVPLLL